MNGQYTLSKAKSLFLIMSLLLLSSLSLADKAASPGFRANQECHIQDANNITVSDIYDEPVTLNGTEVEVIDCDRLDAYDYPQIDTDSSEVKRVLLLLPFLLPLSLIGYGYRIGKFRESVKVFGVSAILPIAGLKALEALVTGDGSLLLLAPLPFLPLTYIAWLYRNEEQNHVLYLAIYIATLISFAGSIVLLAKFATPVV